MSSKPGISPTRIFKSDSPTKLPRKIQTETTTMEALINAIHTTPIIDNHAHPLLRPETQCKHPLLSITSEASGEALKATTSTLSHLRAVKQLSEVLGCKEKWEEVTMAIVMERDKPHDAWNKRCLEGIDTILIDDGLDDENDVYEYSWHSRLTRNKCKRIVRIEAVAQKIMRDLRQRSQHLLVDKMWPEFMRIFFQDITSCIHDPEVAGFKSIICYRGGLKIPAEDDDELRVAARKAYIGQFLKLVKATARDHKTLSRIQGPLNAFLVHKVASMISGSSNPYKHPIQFHSGLGDSDIYLETASGSHLQGFIKTYPRVPIVLLHANYPWTKEAGYLASVYDNVYTDIGEVFPMVSKEGQEKVIREILELCSIKKILWSTDGRFSETYLLAVIQIREALETVLCDYVRTGTMTVNQGISAVQNILFKNSNKLYDLQLSLVNLPYSRRQETTSPSRSPTRLPRTPARNSRPASLRTALKVTTVTRVLTDETSDQATQSPAKPVVLTPQSPEKQMSFLETPSRPVCVNYDTLVAFLQDNPDTKFLRLQYLDYTATLRLRVIPITRVLHTLEINRNLSVNIASAALAVLQNDTCPEDAGVPAVGQLKLQAIMTSLRSGPSMGYASVQCEFKNNESKDSELCPRSICRRVIERAKSENLKFLLGFEIEIVFFALDESTGKYTTPPGFGRSRSWGSSRGFNYPLPLKLVDDIFDKLTAAGIHLEYFHSESADCQYEFILPPLPPLEAIDTLVQARQIIVTVAQSHNLRATLFPKPFPTQAGTAAHVHISIVPTYDLKSKAVCQPQVNVPQYESFYAGVLKHLGSILAFSYSQSASYDRIADTCWAGGTWVCWGTENREAPLRKIEGSHWEIKVLDGLANPYFAIAAIISAGTQGVVDSEPLILKDCQHDPGMLSMIDRARLGIMKKLPKDFSESLRTLERDDQLKELLGVKFVERYLSVKCAERKMLNEMTAEERKEWIIERY